MDHRRMMGFHYPGVFKGLIMGFHYHGVFSRAVNEITHRTWEPVVPPRSFHLDISDGADPSPPQLQRTAADPHPRRPTILLVSPFL
eukprot:scaffold32631_cov36-Tisochrysis_lutea.AAC.1